MKKYIARPHAKERALLRFGITEENADNWFNQLMTNARFIGSDGKKEIYDHKGKRIIVDGLEIVTVTKAADLPFGNKISKLVERELNKAQRNLRKKEYELAIKIAELKLDLATYSLNQLKAKAKSVKAKFDKQIDEVNAKVAELKLELSRERDEFNRLKLYSIGYLIETETAN
jgi:hypothetical protein